MKVRLIFLLILSSSLLFSQENHYWTNQFGPTSTYLSGAVTGGVRDNSSIFYNPAAAAFTSYFNISIQSSDIINYNLYVRNGAGTGLNVHQNRWEGVPQLVSLTFGNKKRPRFRTSMGLLSTTYSNIRLRARNEVVGTFNSNRGEEVYLGSWNYGNRVREDMAGLAFVYRIGEDFAIGLTTFITFRSYEYQQTLNKSLNSVTEPLNPDFQRYVSQTSSLDGAAAGLMFKLGMAYEVKEFKLGLTVTPPRFQANTLAKINYERSSFVFFSNPLQNNLSQNYSLILNRANSTYHSPWVFDFGFMKNFLDTDLYVRVAYFSAISKYNMIEPDETGEITNAIIEQVPGAAEVKMAHKEVWNFAFGWHRNITKSFSMMAGFRTDFNYIDAEALDQEQGISPQLSTWDLYHLTAGTTINVLKNNFTVGLSYTRGFNEDFKQFVNLDAPSGDQFFNSRADNATAWVDQLGINIGWVYNFRDSED